MSSRVVRANTLPLERAPLDDSQRVGADPGVASAVLAKLPVTLPGEGIEVGVWEHGVGTSTDVEADEVFVVLSGRATVRVEGGETLELGPGDLGILEAGARTVWTVHQTLRKVYVVAG